MKPDMGETWRLGQSRKVDGRTVRYDVVGAGAPVVVVHGTPWLSFNRQMAQADAAYSETVQPHYGSIDEPSLVLWGEADTWIPIAQGRRLAAALGNSRFASIPNAGHLVIEEAPGALLGEITGFLGES